MRLSVVSLPHTSTTAAYSCCAYTQKVLKFCNMMTRHGHEVYLYGGPENETLCTEFISCISHEEQARFGFHGPENYLSIDFNAEEPWRTFHDRTIKEMRQRVQPREIICVITGYPTLPIAEAFPDNLVVEFGVGYSGITHRFRVFESYAWRNYCYGYHRLDGVFFDAVIPNYFDVEDFPFAAPSDYYLFLGRLIPKKGLHIAQQVCERLGKRLLVAGPGNFSGYGEYQGVVGPAKRADLLAHAIATFVPTLYVGPFESTHVESLLCGRPVITTDFGVFTETVENGWNGQRCTTFREFCDATDWATSVTPVQSRRVREEAIGRFSMEAVAPQYEAYFEKLLTLYGAGWYA